MKSTMNMILLVSVLMMSAMAESDQNRLANCARVLDEIMKIPDGIPQDLLDKAECVIIMPSVVKVAIGIGGSYGRGAMVCRTGPKMDGPWSAPAMYRLEGGNIGVQLGGTATDFVLLVMNPRGIEGILSSKVKLGADASAAAGPKGRSASAETDATLRAEILSYSRARGLFAGVSLAGSSLRQDSGANKNIYGREISAKEIVLEGKIQPTGEGKNLVAILQKVSPKNLSK